MSEPNQPKTGHGRKPTNGGARRAGAFTLVELLVVIGIIVVLIGILVPVVSKVRTRAYATNSLAQIQLLSGSIQQYHDVFGAYPGALDDDDNQVLRKSTMGNPANRFTTSELLVFALCGGLQLKTPVANPPQVQMVATDVGKGPMSLNNPAVSMPKRYDAFVDPKQGGVDPLVTYDSATKLVNGWYPWKNQAHGSVPYASNNVYNDTAGPEFVDRFPDALPILYIRAKPGAAGTVGHGPNAPNSGWGPPTGANGAIPFAYDVDLLTPYQAFPSAQGQFPLAFLPATDGHRKALQYSNPSNTYPLRDIAYYFAEPVDQNTVPLTNLVARQKSGYFLIGAGIDRVYATPDDITNAGPVKP